VCKAGRTAKKRRKEGDGRGRSGRSFSERTWGEQAEYVSVTPRERQTNGKRTEQSANRERGRTKRAKKDYNKAKRVLFKRRLRLLERSNEAKRKAQAQQVFCTARSPTLQSWCYYSSFSTPLALNSNSIRPQKQCYKNDKEGGVRKSPVLSRK
jgi:hypothetical protein